MKLRPPYRAEKLKTGEWVTTDGMSRLYEYAGPSQKEAEGRAKIMNSLLASNAKNDEEREHFLGR